MSMILVVFTLHFLKHSSEHIVTWASLSGCASLWAKGDFKAHMTNISVISPSSLYSASPCGMSRVCWALPAAGMTARMNPIDLTCLKRLNISDTHLFFLLNFTCKRKKQKERNWKIRGHTSKALCEVKEDSHKGPCSYEVCRTGKSRDGKWVSGCLRLENKEGVWGGDG